MVEYQGSPLSPVCDPDASPPASIGLSTVLKLASVAAVGLLVANCSSAQKVASSRGGGIDPKYGVAASPKMVADGEAVPKGGGREMVGKPYVVAGRLYTPRPMTNYSAVGTASWYGPSFHGRMTANGEVFDKFSISAAHPTMPLPSYVRVTNTSNGRSIVARVNDRGPYHGNRLIDVSQRVAEALSFKHLGTARVRVDYLSRASTAGSDDARLFATLRTDGGPAELVGGPTMVASATPVAPAQPRETTIVQRTVEAPRAPALFSPAVVALAPAAQAPATQAVAALAPSVGKPAPGIPLPPDRPFDLGGVAGKTGKTVPTPLPRTASTSGTRTASLFFSEPEAGATSTFGKDPMALLISQTFVPIGQTRPKF
ncbi:MAG: septal ring lytic transglycosylase RlpA family protein [Burkholderiales bacterium]|nr:septal ring lytic transglycosylase RlpA family protein [Burkholderiales bacterium]